VLGEVAAQRGETRLAIQRLETAATIHRSLGYNQGLAIVLTNLAYWIGDHGEIARAARLLHEGLCLPIAASRTPHVVMMIEQVAQLLLETQPLAGVRLAGAADALRARAGTHRARIARERFQRWMEQAARVCEPRAFEQAWDQGRRMTPAQANAEAVRLAALLMVAAPGQALTADFPDQDASPVSGQVLST
jgi:hypothetical protein